MTHKTDPFDLDNLRLPPEPVSERRAVVPKKIQKQLQHFVKVPGVWVERLKEARNIATYRIALHVLYQNWKGNGAPFTLSNAAALSAGVSRWCKYKALQELERLGLIVVEWRPRRSPQVTVIP